MRGRLAALTVLVLSGAPSAGAGGADLARLWLGNRVIDLPRLAPDRGRTARLPLNLLVSAHSETLLATLAYRGWSPRGPDCPGASGGEVLLGDRPADHAFERGGASIDERYALWLWRRGETVRGLPLWAAVASVQRGVRPLAPPAGPTESSAPARDQVLADLSYGVSQARQARPGDGSGAPLPWVELTRAPEEAERLVRTLARLAAVDDADATAAHCAPPSLAQLPQVAPVSPAVVRRGEDASGRVALTFDACSTLDRSRFDERVVRTLVEHAAPATLFVSGRWAETHVDEIRLLAQEPLFEIANHAYVHPHMTEVPPARQREELLWAQAILFSLTGRVARFFRPPYGEVDDGLAAQAASLGLTTVQYDVASGDADPRIPPRKLAAWVIARARPGSIVVMHMNRQGWHTADVLPDIIRGLRHKGLVLSNVGDLLAAGGRRACR